MEGKRQVLPSLSCPSTLPSHPHIHSARAQLGATACLSVQGLVDGHVHVVLGGLQLLAAAEADR